MTRRALFSFYLIFISSALFAQGSLPSSIDEIVVTADFRHEMISDISNSISVLSAELIEKKNAQHLEDILLDAPNVNFASGASRARFYQIRGIGERGQFSEQLNPSVGLIIDGVDFSGIGNAAMLYDVEQVEVLMGPQGTRYGSNALAGLINLQTKAPTEYTSYGLQLEAGNYDSYGLAGYASGALSDNLLFRVSGQTLESDGFSNNITLNRPTNQRDESTVRGKLRWLVDDNTTWDFNTSLIDIDNGYDAFSLDNIRDTLSDEPGFDRQESQIFSTKLSTDTFDNFSLEALVAFANSDIDYGYDEDWSFVGLHPSEYSSTDHYLRERDTLSGEIRLLSNANSALFSDSTDWVVGLYSLQQQVDLTRIYTYLPANFSSAYDIDRVSIFAETNTLLNDQWSLDLGIRAERFNSSYTDSALLNFSPNENLYGGKVALNYTNDTEDLLYLSLSRGYKTGGFNIDGSLDADLREFASEELWNYELGFKGFLFNDQVQTQIALFYMDRDDVQIGSSTSRLRSNGSTEFIQYVGNAAAGSNYGLELNATWLGNDTFDIYSSLGLLESEYQNFINSAGANLDGREQAHAPAYQFTVGTNITLSPKLELNINLQGKDDFFFSDSHSIKSKSYELLNANLSYSIEQWRISVWGRNLIDEDYHVRGFFFGNDPRDGYTAKGYTQLGEPRRFGITLNYDL